MSDEAPPEVEPVKCFAPNCANHGSHMPVIFFGTGARKEEAIEQSGVCRLEVPRLVCYTHQRSFHPSQYVGEFSRSRIAAIIKADFRTPPSWRWWSVIWLPSTHRLYAELKGENNNQLWWGLPYVGV